MALGNVSKWARFASVCYLRGKGLVATANQEIFPTNATALNVFAAYADSTPHPKISVCAADLAAFAQNYFDYVFVGDRLFLQDNPSGYLAEAVSKLKVGGYLISLQKTDSILTPTTMQERIATKGSWRKVLELEHEEGYFVQVYKKKNGPKGIEVKPSADVRPRACVCRYGALGDMIILTPLLRRLHEDGYHVTLNITNYSAPVVEYNPFVDNLLLQEKDAIPNIDLSEYWDFWRPHYDKYINLSESCEGSLLKVEGRREFYTTSEWRRAQCGSHNYYDFTLRLGGYSDVVGSRGELYFSPAEERAAKDFLKQFGGSYNILWALNGSSYHKVYGIFQPVVTEFLDRNPKARIITVGDARANCMEFQHPQLIPRAGAQTLRHTLALTKFVQCVVGVESVVINAAGCFDTPKIPLLSHSTHQNLCANWKNDYCLAPDVELAPCYPCHQLHYTPESCPCTQILNPEGVVVASGPRCAMGAIQGERLITRLEEVMGRHFSTQLI
jgi:ADP-heptose:LPS heptosyltransferase